jgi:hypothetical protein
MFTDMRVGLFLFTCGLLAQDTPAQITKTQETPLTRDGAYWVRTSTGAAAVKPHAQVQILTRGRISLRGSKDARLSYRLIQRVKARSEEEARQWIGPVTAASQTTDSVTRLVVEPASSVTVLTELEVSVPRGIPAVVLETRMGGIEAYDFDGNVRAVTPGGWIRADRIRGDLSGRTGGGEIRLGKIGGSVHCVSGGGSVQADSVGGEMNCETAGGEINVGQAGGQLTLWTQGGNVHVDRAGASVEAHSGAGVIEVLQAAGLVSADTQGGAIRVGLAQGVKCESAAGPVRVRSGSGSLRVATLAGSILAELIGAARLGDSSLVAGNGDITVLIPSNVAVTVAARNDSGGNARIISDFPEFRTQSIGFSRQPLMAGGDVNGGGPMLNISAARGVIYLRKTK